METARQQTAQPLQRSGMAAVALYVKSHVTEGVYISRTTFQLSKLQTRFLFSYHLSLNIKLFITWAAVWTLKITFYLQIFIINILINYSNIDVSRGYIGLYCICS